MTTRVPPQITYLDVYDALLLDMDGTLMHGSVPIHGASEGVQAARDARRHVAFVTNNASRSPDQVVAHLAGVGVPAQSDEVITSPQIAAQLLASQVPREATIMVVGGESLAAEIAAAGLNPVFSDEESVAGVVQGWAPSLDWQHLAEGAYSLARGVPWVATNTDATLPTEKGLAPGNGSLVAALRHASGREPQVAGKPEPAMFQQAAERLGARAPLAVGDRLDTDIEGGNRAGIPTYMVLTGVNTALDALRAVPVQRPTWIERDMLALSGPAQDAVCDGDRARCAGASATWEDGDIRLSTDGQDVPAIRAALSLIGAHCPDEGWNGRLLDAAGTEITAPLQG